MRFYPIFNHSTNIHFTLSRHYYYKDVLDIQQSFDTIDPNTLCHENNQVASLISHGMKMYGVNNLIILV